MNDWRLTNQTEYLFGKKLKHQIYKPWNKDWDHDHCEFCGEKFSELENDLHTGYTANDGYYWICETCFHDFKVQFHWTVENAENDLNLPGDARQS